MGVVADVVQTNIQGAIAEFCVACQGVYHAIRAISIHLGVELDNVVSLGVDGGFGDHDC